MSLMGFLRKNNSLTYSAKTGKLNKMKLHKELFTIMADVGRQAEQWLSANKAGNLLGVTGKTVIRMAEKGEITGYRVGNVWRFKRRDIEAYLEAHRYGPDQQSDDD